MKQQGLLVCSVFLFFMVVICLVSAQGFYSSGGRYGKRDSENTQQLQDDHISRRSSRLWSGRGSADVQQVAPRAERFFMGSRYGKRAPVETTNGSGMESDLEENEQLSCRFTGVINLYRCMNSKERLSIDTEGSVQDTVNN